MKKKKSKNNQSEASKPGSKGEPGPKPNVFKSFSYEMDLKTTEFRLKNHNLLDTKFYLFQSLKDQNAVRDMIFNLTYFYDINYTGNKDFIHIPNISNIMENVVKYPILIASRTDENGTEDILGTTTIKVSDSKVVNPYFPTHGEKVYTITGILTKMNAIDKDGNKIKGVGKELFKSAIRTAYYINKTEKIRLISEIDCRNIQSFGAVCKAVKELKEESNLNINVSITGYYEIINQFGELTEAPTFILEIDLNGNKEMLNNNLTFDYYDCKPKNLFTDLNNVIEANTKEIKEYVNKLDSKTIIYHNLEDINALNVKIEAYDTAKGNERLAGVNVLELTTTTDSLV